MRRALLVTFACVTLGVSLFFSWHDEPARVAPLALRLERERAWHLTWKSHDVTVLTGPELSSDLELDATLRLRPLGDGQLEAKLEGVHLARLDFLGQPAPLGAALFSTPVRLTLDAAGRTTALAFPDDADPLVGHLLSALFDELRFDLDAANEGRTLDEPNRLGLGTSRYERTRTGFTRLAVAQRELLGVEHAELTTTGRDDVEWDGFVVTRHATRTLEAKQRGARVLASEERLDLVPCAVPTAPWSATAAWEDHQRFAVSARAEAAALEQRIGGLTAEAFADALTQYGASGQLPNHNRWLWQATGLLQKDAKLCAEVERFFLDAANSTAGRTLALDLLASAGTPEAQAALRRLLDSPTARTDASWPLWLQRLSLVQEPTKDTAQFAAAELGRATRRDDVGASAAAVGAVARGLAKRDPAYAAELGARLQAGFSAAPDAVSREAWVLALGNTGDPAVRPQLDTAAADASPMVRAGAAWALRTIEGSGDTLARLATDADPRVREAAITSLAHAPFSLAQVSAAVLASQPDAAVDAAWANLLSAHLAEPGVRELLEQLLARTSEPQLAARLRTLLAS